MDDLLTNAYKIAEAAHAGQVRRVSGKPYITHPRRVADILLNARVDQETIAAGYLHDVYEDGPDEVQLRLVEEMGLSVATPVALVTHMGKGDGEKYATLSRLVGFYPPIDTYPPDLIEAYDRAVCVFLADKIANVEDAWQAYVHNECSYQRVRRQGLNITRTVTWAGACYSALRSVETQLPEAAHVLLDDLRDRLNEYPIEFL